MQILKKGCIFLYLVFSASLSFAQQVFYLEPSTAASIKTATYDHSKKAVMFFSGNNVFYYPVGSDKTVVPEWYSMEGFKSIDAALDWDDDNSLIFSGSTYRTFKHSTGEFITPDTRWPGLPGAWNNNLDGAVKWDKDIIFFFYKKEYAVYSISADSIVDYNDITTWNGWPATWSNGIDDAFNIDDGFIYFINHGEIMPYSLADKTFFNPLKITSSNITPNTGSAFNPPPGSGNRALKPAAFTPNTNNQTAAVNEVQSPANSLSQGTNSLASSGCVTGAPAGSALREVQTPVEGDQQGRLFSDNFPKGYRIAEIKIYTSKIWGKTVISGIQTVLLSSSAQRIEQTVLGRKTISEYIFPLDDDECITGISGTRNGETGNFIYSVQILTSKRTSQVYGERMNEKGRESFSIAMPDQSVFNGFAGNFSTNMTGIGIKYYGQESTGFAAASLQVNYSNANTNEAATGQVVIPGNNGNNYVQLSSDNNSGNAANAPQPIVDAYLDNYQEYTQDQSNNNFWGKGPMPGLDWLGVGFDILKFDPLNPNETKNRKLFRAIVITNSGERAGNEAQYLKPFGTMFGSVNSGNDIDSSSWVESYKSFTNTFNVGGTGTVSIPEAASASLSASYSEMNSTSVGSESIYHFSKVIKKIHEMDLLQTWKDANTGQKYKQKIYPVFKDDIAALPVIRTAVPAISIDQMIKNQPLPGGLEQIKSKYLDFISKYGTHYASHVAWGGQYISRVQIKRADYETARMSQQDFKYAAEATIKKVKLGYSVEFGSGETGGTGNKKGVFRKQIYVQGGNGETNLEKWEDKVDKAPAPVEFYFTPYVDLMTKDMFPNDPEIETKSKILRIITEKYLVDNMRPPVESKDDFFRPLPDLPMPASISVKNGGGYVIYFDVKYELNGQWKTEESSSFTLGRTLSIQIPEDAKQIKLKVYLLSFTTSVIFEENFAKPEVKCYKVWGTIFSQGHSECDK
ncbi:MAG: MAC/perforin domain-containing protein [Ginsengibacter sp.]